MYAFEYHRPTSVGQAASLATEFEDVKFLAGGHTLLPTMKLRLAGPANLIDLGRIAELRGIGRSGQTITIGAMTTHAEVANSAEVREAIPALAEMAELIGDPHVRHRGTIGGSIANNDPSADYPAACLALNATIVTNNRRIAADEFFQGIFTTALEEGEIITEVSFQIPEQAAYAKFRNPASRYALVGVFVARYGSEARVAVTGAGANGVFRVPEMEQALGRQFSPDALDGITVPADGMNSDIHADAAYRAHLVGVMARRAVQAATSRG
ncbi:MAG TPA: xanthine dehydrogenase family protein subunit M [Microvirga sp.]|nr:xanthine dehydrogenase family protein subunit M [Microvirga sp.]